MGSGQRPGSGQRERGALGASPALDVFGRERSTRAFARLGLSRVRVGFRPRASGAVRGAEAGPGVVPAAFCQVDPAEETPPRAWRVRVLTLRRLRQLRSLERDPSLLPLPPPPLLNAEPREGASRAGVCACVRPGDDRVHTAVGQAQEAAGKGLPQICTSQWGRKQVVRAQSVPGAGLTGRRSGVGGPRRNRTAACRQLVSPRKQVLSLSRGLRGTSGRPPDLQIRAPDRDAQGRRQDGSRRREGAVDEAHQQQNPPRTVVSWRGAVIEPEQGTELPSRRAEAPSRPSSWGPRILKHVGKAPPAPCRAPPRAPRQTGGVWTCTGAGGPQTLSPPSGGAQTCPEDTASLVAPGLLRGQWAEDVVARTLALWPPRDGSVGEEWAQPWGAWCPHSPAPSGGALCTSLGGCTQRCP
ncbi:uncharacterized protein LOC118499400 [Phyllostomus discolor]|uniref:Uncharacterized protein LOC118499400 n=1 Tax=Phyllostomus discolor TaxID=89673 RepID=A0A7E6DAP8_9CHIR|nr:uncharacterized protein LOC118499400 [Phyllostomus discolor]